MGTELYRPGDVWRGEFSTRNISGAATPADALPTAVISKNGVDDVAPTFSIALISGNRYRASVTIPSAGYAAHDKVAIWITVAVGGIPDSECIDSFRLIANDVTDTDLSGLPAAIATIVAQTALIGAVSASLPATTGAAFDPAGAETCVYWAQTFVAGGISIVGWTKITFTIKRSALADEDADALLAVRITNPASAGTDGILVFNRRPVDSAASLRGKAALTVLATNPDATVNVALRPEALDLSPSLPNQPFAFELDWWDASGIKRQFGRGEFTLARSVRRGITAP